tara:strand:- start:380 stop:2014 length:1635 start_codon:yes stop_codon:yes gene_type:complete
MKKILDNIKVLFKDLIQVSKLTKTKNKKLKITLLAMINNSLVIFDILIILYFSKLFSEVTLDNSLIEFFLSREYLFPFFIIFRYLAVYFERIVTTSLQMDIEQNLREHLLSEIFDKGNFSIADAYFYVNTLCVQVGGFYSTLATFFGSLIQILLFTSYLLITNFNIVMIFGIGSILLIIPTYYFAKLGRKYAHITYTSGQEISEEIEKVLDSLYLIKIVNKVKDELLKFSSNLDLLYSSRLKDIKYGTINAAMPNFITLFSLSILLVFFNFINKLSLDFIGILLRLFQSLSNLNKNIHLVSTFHVSLEKLYEVEKNKEQINKSNYVTNYENKNDDISVNFSDVTFKYFNSEDNIFNNLNLKIYKNKHTIITGPNGSGKSTILGLAAGILYSNSGKIETSAKKFGYVSATPMILNASLLDNLNYGNEVAVSEEELMKQIKLFQLFKEDKNYDLSKTISNKTLSTGQMQKISFIRALSSGADILILDESTSNLDTETKKLIYKIMSQKELTIINSTHSQDEIFNYDYEIKITIDDGKRIVSLVENN